jgi:hypothetical protein
MTDDEPLVSPTTRQRPSRREHTMTEQIAPPTSDEWLSDLPRKVDDLSDQIQELHTQLLATQLLKLPSSEVSVRPVQRRRTEDDLHHALKLLVGGGMRPKDDDSPQCLEDCINEMIWLRQLVAEMMQRATGMYQSGLATIRQMTEK